MADNNNTENDSYQYEEYVPPPEATHWKRLIVCCDGTGQTSTSSDSSVPTNVTRFARGLKTSTYIPEVPADESSGQKFEPAREIPQIVLYQTGIGTDGATGVDGMIAGAFGVGLDTHVLEAYTFLSNNYETGDEIFLFGFSRGAFTARAIASLICNAGLLKKDFLEYLPLIYSQYKKRRDTADKRQEFEKWLDDRKSKFEHHKEVIIHILGLWDTVGSLGVPQTWISSALEKLGLPHNWNEGYGYHDTSFPLPTARKDFRGFIAKAYQALALEEQRTSFGPTLLYFPEQTEEALVGHGTEFNQVWFPGVHTDVGGGYERAYRDISDISFAWMVDMCSSTLTFRDGLSEAFKKTSLAVMDPAEPRPKNQKVPKDLGYALSETHDEFHTIKFRAGGSTARKPGQYFLDKVYDAHGEKYKTNEWMHPCVRIRMQRMPNWRPAALEGFELIKGEEGWKWKKAVQVAGKGKVDVEIPEWSVYDDEYSLQGPLLDDEARKLFKNDSAFDGILKCMVKK